MKFTLFITNILLLSAGRMVQAKTISERSMTERTPSDEKNATNGTSTRNDRMYLRRGLGQRREDGPPRDLAAASIKTTMPDEASPHRGTWLQWPHPYTYGIRYRNMIEPTWVAMTQALVNSEEVNIIVYDTTIRSRAQDLLRNAGVSLTNVKFYLCETNDVWVRDNGPMFVKNQGNELEILDWYFNGWGDDAPYRLDNHVPVVVGSYLGLGVVNLESVELEGGAVEVDGRGTLMATRSSVLENGRNVLLTQSQMEQYMLVNMGVEKVIWLNGRPGGRNDITNKHIDGFARFGDPNTIVTMNRAALLAWGLPTDDIDTLYGASDLSEKPYKFLYLPLTANTVSTTDGRDLGYRGSYVNFYVGNTVVLIPSYDDPNDSVARNELQKLYSDRTVVSIDAQNLYKEGGMIHCVTQQQPL